MIGRRERIRTSGPHVPKVVLRDVAILFAMSLRYQVVDSQNNLIAKALSLVSEELFGVSSFAAGRFSITAPDKLHFLQPDLSILSAQVS